MKESKYLEIGPEMEKVLTEICDAALKKEGMRILNTVNQLVASIQMRGDE